MNIALFAQSRIFRALQTLVCGWRVDTEHVRRKLTSPVQRAHPVTPKSIASCALMARATTHSHALPKPLRVVRVVEAGQDRSSVGRLVISGRMSDVCAELDRLAAGEAALS